MSSAPGRLLVVALLIAVPLPAGAQAPALPEGALARVGTTRLSHGGYAIVVAFAPDGKTIASAGNDRLVRVWDVASGTELRRCTGHGGNVDTVAYAPDGKTLASGSSDQTIRLWDFATGKEKAVLRGSGGGVNTVVFSPDGKQLASKGHDGACRLWDLATNTEAKRFACSADSGTSNLVFTPDGKHVVAVGEDNAVRLWEIASGNEVRRFAGHTDNVHSLDVSADGKWVASASMDRSVRLWDVATGKEVRPFAGHTDLASAVRFSPDGKTLASCAGDKTIRLWDLATGKELRQMHGHVALVSEVSFSPDGKTLASASWDYTVRLWDVATGKELPQSQRDGGPLVSATLSPDGKTLAAGHRDGSVRLWDAASGKSPRLLIGEPSPVVTLAFSPAGDLLALRTLDGGVKLVETATGKPRHSLILPVLQDGGAMSAPRANDLPGSLAFAPDGKSLAAIDAAGALTVWDVAEGKKVSSPAMGEQGALRVAFSPDGRLLAAVNRGDGVVRLWSTSTWQEVRQLIDPVRRGGLPSLAFSPDGRTLVTASANASGVTWELATGLVRSRSTRPQERHVAYPPSGGLVAAAVGDAVQLWSPLTNKTVRTLASHGAVVTSVATSDDGRRLATVGVDGTAVVWDVASAAKEARPAETKLTPPQLDGHWETLAGADAVKAGEAIAALVAAGDQAATLARQRLKQAEVKDPKQIAQLVVALDDDDFNVREKASRELERVGAQAAPELRKALKGEPSAEAMRRIGELLKKIEGGSASGDRLRALRALEVLEALASPEARRTLDGLAKGPAGDWLTQEAKAALERLARHPAP